MVDLLDYAQLAGRVYNRTRENEMPIPEGWSELDWQEDHVISGFSVGAYESTATNEIVISFTGSNENLAADFIFGNIPAAFGLSSYQIHQAVFYTLDVMAAHPEANISFTGHSLA